jgi:hypothetical protein
MSRPTVQCATRGRPTVGRPTRIKVAGRTTQRARHKGAALGASPSLHGAATTATSPQTLRRRTRPPTIHPFLPWTPRLGSSVVPRHSGHAAVLAWAPLWRHGTHSTRSSRSTALHHHPLSALQYPQHPSTAAPGLQQHPLYSSTRSTAAPALQQRPLYSSPRSTAAPALQQHPLYSSARFTAAPALQQHPLYSSARSTAAPALQQHPLYSSIRSTAALPRPWTPRRLGWWWWGPGLGV